MSEYIDEIDSDNLRIRLEEKYEYRKDIINCAREHWQTRNKTKAVMRSADAFVDVVEDLQQLLASDEVSDDLKRELAERLDSRHLRTWYDIDVGFELNR